MCGIVAAVARRNVVPILLEGLKRLEYRGYDSAGVAVVNEPGGKVTLFIADYYNGHVRAVGPDGIIRDLSDEGREAFGAPTRVAFAASGPKRGWLYVADSSEDKIVPLIIPRIAPNLVPPPRPPARRVGG